MSSTPDARGRTRSGGLALTLVALLLAACSSAPIVPPGATPPGGGPAVTPVGGGGGGGGGGPTGHICDLVPEAAVTAIVAKKLNETTREDTGCNWSYDDADSGIPGVGGTINLRVEGTDTSLSGAKTAFPGGEDLGGIGDRAYWAKSVSVLYFAKGGTEYAVQLVLFDDTEPEKDIAVKVAQLLLAKI